MKVLLNLVAVLAMLAMVTTVQAGHKAPKGERAAKAEKAVKGDRAARKAAVRGQVVKVDGNKLVINSGKKNNQKELTIETDANTVVTIEGKQGKLADLQPGQRVVVKPETGTATSIEVPMPKPKKDAKQGAGQ